MQNFVSPFDLWETLAASSRVQPDRTHTPKSTRNPLRDAEKVQLNGELQKSNL